MNSKGLGFAVGWKFLNELLVLSDKRFAQRAPCLKVA
ncbi:MAG: hypothetical protein JWM99_875 [Verrucomicrobiales bacterium]|nr:hypothetical protein [Verrucomicrobiales bacterium]